jgi:hypothetical protein
VFTQAAAGWCRQQLGQEHRPKHVEPTWVNTLIYMVRLVGYFHYLKAAHKFQIN